jgi:DMSO reductase anchor subunit
MLAWLGVLAAAGLLPASVGFGIAAVGIATALFTAGLLASLGHLGHPERAWRALSQWRSSWLSREGVAAAVTYLPLLAFAGLWLATGTPPALPGLLAAIGAAATVVCTAMIYASLKTVRQWNHALVPPFYLLAGAFSGAVVLAAVTSFADRPATLRLAVLAALLGIVAAAVKLAYWRGIDAARPSSSIASATGLGHLGPVRSFEAPHTDENYLLREMGFRIARRHAARLRRIALLAGFALPVLLMLGLTAGFPAAPVAVAAAASAMLGLLVERWLFFAEATHTVTLFYGRAG